ETIRKAMIGYNPDWSDVAGVGRLAPGVVVPCFDGAPDYPLWYVKVRTFRPKLDKYRALKGSIARSLFNARSIVEHDFGVIVEGEFDCLLTQQEAGDVAAAITSGSAQSLPNDNWRRYLGLLRGAFIALDADESGQAGIEKWQRLIPWIRPMPPFVLTPSIRLTQETKGINKITDVTDFWRCGGDVRAWVVSALQSAEVGIG
ncbi:MAG: toprim domain-containing protein, partial [Anaerolineae bacterium]|nr:toprim domain-containing protein [Anaerolineae bacterium]